MSSKTLNAPTSRRITTVDRAGAAPCDAWNAIVLRITAVAAQAATIWITWPLWMVRPSYPDPMLPALPLPQLDVAPWLLGSLVLVLFVPRWGVIFHGFVLLWAILLDQIRMQPECISLFVLMLGTLGSPGLKLLARSHLIALWFFAGFHKLISPGYYEAVVPFMTGHLPGEAASSAELVLGVLAAVFEMALGVLAVVPRTRRLCAILAAPFHLAVLSLLAFHLHWNEAVCPWNAAIAVAGFTLIWPWRSSPREDWQRASRVGRVAVAFVLFSPLLFYVGLMDPFLAYCVYSKNTPEASIIVPGSDTKIDINGILNARLNVAIPPEHRLFEAYFDQVAEPGEKLIIEDPRWWAKLRGYAHREIIKPAENPPRK